MEPAWKIRLRKAMADKNLTRGSLGKLVGRNPRLIYDLLDGTDDPRADTLDAVARALGMTASELRDGTVPARAVSVPVVGGTLDGTAWSLYDDVSGELEMSIFGGEAIALEVRGDSMMPAFRNGDIIVGIKATGRSPSSLIGQECIIETKEGERFVRFLARGTAPGRFNLRSYNPAHPDIENAQLQWIAPITWIKRGGL